MNNSTHDTLAWRLSDILIRLNLGERLNVGELARQYQVSERTIRRDLKERFAFLNWQEDGPHHYRLNTLELGQFTYSDMSNLFAFLGVQELLPLASKSELINQIQDMKSNSIAVRGLTYENLRHQFSCFNCVKNAIEKQQYLSFLYKKRGKKQFIKYTVQPYQLLNQNGVWYVLALHQELIKSFCLSRCQEMHLTEETFIQDHLILKRIKQENSIYFQEQIAEVKISVPAIVADYFIRRSLFPKQSSLQENDDGSLLIYCKNVHENEILPIVQYWIPHLKIIEPIQWQEKINQQLLGYLKNEKE